MKPTKSGKAESRRRSRVKAVLPVRISGKDGSGKAYSEIVHTLDVSAPGVRLGALHHPLEVGSLITLQYKQHKAEFRVVWSRPVAGTDEHQVGAEALNPKDLAGFGAAWQAHCQPQQPMKAVWNFTRDGVQ
jgi:PilZ domain